MFSLGVFGLYDWFKHMRKIFICTIGAAMITMAEPSESSAGGWSGWNCGWYAWCRTWGSENWGWRGIGWGSYLGSYYYSFDSHVYPSVDPNAYGSYYSYANAPRYPYTRGCYRQVRVIGHHKSVWRRDWVCN